MAFEVEGKNIRLFPEHEQVRIFGRFESFLTGLEFHLHCISLTEQIDPQTAAPLLMQKEALATLGATPRVQALQLASIQAQEQQMSVCTRTRHFLVVSVSSVEAASNPQGSSPSVLFYRNASAHVQKDSCAFPVSGARSTPYSSGSHPKSVSAPGYADLAARRSRTAPLFRTVWLLEARCQRLCQKWWMGREHSSHKPSYQKRLRGMHGTFSYTSHHRRHAWSQIFSRLQICLAPSSIEVHPDMLIIRAGKQTRYMQTMTVTGYGHHLPVGGSIRCTIWACLC